MDLREINQPLTLELIKPQWDLVNSKARRNIAAGGIQSGKSLTGSLWAVKQSQPWVGSDNNAIISAPDFPTLRQATLPRFLKVAGRFIQDYNQKDQVLKMTNGLNIYLRTANKNPWAIEGIDNVRWIWIDEAGNCKHLFYINAEGRAARTNAPIMMTTTPYSRNWLFKDWVQPARRNAFKDEDLCYRQWSSKDNPTFNAEYYEEQRNLLDPQTFAMKYDGEFSQRKGLVYDLKEDMMIDKAPIDIVEYYAGVDWGYSDPFVVTIRGISKTHDVQVKEVYERWLTPEEVKDTIGKLYTKYKVKMFVADPSRPDLIEMIQRARIPISPAPNDIREGIEAHGKIMRSGRFQILKECKETIDEFEMYHWPQHDDLDIDAEDVPEDDFNHTMDANRYVSLYLDKAGLSMGLREKKLTHSHIVSKKAESKTGTQPWLNKLIKHIDEL